MGRVLRFAVAGVALAGLLVSCIPVYYGADWSAYADVPPPEPYAEVIPPAPGPDYGWVNGYWYWNGATYVWVRGYWAVRPYPGYVWLHSGWVHRYDRYVFVPGRWVPPGHHHRFHYIHPVPPVRRGNTYRAVPRHRGTPAPRRAPRRHPVRPAR